MRARIWLVALSLTAGLGACARRDVPYRFRAPVLSSVRAARLPPASPQEPEGPMVAQRGGHNPGAELSMQPMSGPRHTATGPEPDLADTGTVVAQPSTVAQALRDLAGQHEADVTSARFAMTTLAALGAQLDERLHQVATGADLLALAETRGALTQEPPLTGDLVLLDPRGDADLLVGIVVQSQPVEAVPSSAAAAEIIYLVDGRVQRALVAPGRGRAGQDSAACTAEASSPEVPVCLVSERFRGYLRLDRLAR